MLLHKNVSCHEDVIVTPKPSTRQTIPLKMTFFFSSDGCHCWRGAASCGMMARPLANRPRQMLDRCMWASLNIIQATREITICPDNQRCWLQRIIVAGFIEHQTKGCGIYFPNSRAQEHKCEEMCFRLIESVVGQTLMVRQEPCCENFKGI